MLLNSIYNENCLDTMAKMPECFVDLVVTSINRTGNLFSNVLDRKDLQGFKVGKCPVCNGTLIQTKRRANECNKCDFYCASAC